MPKEILEIVDTAVKIGLGAIISGIATYTITHKNHSHERNKELRLKKINILEFAIENVEPYFNAFSKYMSIVDGALRAGMQSGTISNENFKEQIYQLDNDFVFSRDKKNISISRLKLIALDDVVDKLLNVQKVENKFRQIIKFDNKLLTQDELEQIRDEFKIKKNEFYKSVQNSFVDVYN